MSKPKLYLVLIVILFFGATFLILWPFLIGREVIVEKFAPVNQYPVLSFLYQSFKHQASTPLWLPGYMSGYPFFVGAFSFLPPLSWILKHLNYLTAFNVLLFLSFFSGSLFMYFFSRNIALSKSASLISASIYTFSQLSMWWSSVLPFAFILPLLPLMFLSVLKISQGRKIFLLPGSLMLAFGWLYGFSEYILYSSAALVFFAFYLDARGPESWRRFWRKLRTLRYTVGMLFVGTLLAIGKILPTFAFIQVSARKTAVPESSAFLGWGDISNMIYPYFKIPFIDLFPALTDHWFYLHFSIPAFILLVVFFLASRKILKENKIIPFFMAIFGVSFLMLFRFTRLFELFQTLTFHLFRGSWKLLFLGNFSLALMAGLGFDAIKEVKFQKSFRVFLSALKYIFAITLLATLVLNFSILVFKDKIISSLNHWFVREFYARTSSGQPLDYYFGLVRKAFDQVVGSFMLSNYHFVVFLGFALLFFLAIYLYQKGRLGEDKFRAAAVGIIVFNFIFLWQGFFLLMPRDIFEKPPAVVEFFKDKPPYDYRIFRFWPGFSAYYKIGLERLDANTDFEIQKEMLTPDMNLIYGISSIEGDENFMSYRYSQLLAFLGSFKAPQNQDKRWIFSDISFLDKLSRIQALHNRNLLSMMNVKYVLTSFEFNSPWKKVFETRVTKDDIPVFIYENPEALPRVYFANSVRFIGSDDQAVFGELISTRNFERATLVECLKPECLYAFSKPSPSDRVEIKEVSPGYAVIKTNSVYPRWLVFSEASLPNWEAKLISQNIPLLIYTANFVYQAIFVPGGENEIEFRYPGTWHQTWYAVEDLLARLVNRF